MKNVKKSLKSFALNKQVISKLQQETILGNGPSQDDRDNNMTLGPLCRTHPVLCRFDPPITKSPACHNHITTSGCNPRTTTGRTIA